jgi:hypothetical protein
MSKSDHIIFEAEKTSAGDWSVVAYCPGTIERVHGFKSKDEAEMWIAGPRSNEWCRQWGVRND